MIARIWVWFNPPIPPVIAPIDAIIIVIVEVIGWRIWVKIRIGAVFWIVAKIKHIGHDKEFIIAGNQKWHGAAPNLIRIATISIAVAWFENSIKIDLKSIIMDARACVKKYLIEASFSWLIEDWRISGIKE